MDLLPGKRYTGIVEDNNDPRRLGRCKIRIPFSYNDIPTANIPWASPKIPSSGTNFSIPAIGKMVSVFFLNENVYMPYYEYTDNYNINLQDKLDSLSDKEYRNFNTLLFNHRTRIYSDTNALTLDYLVNRIRIDKSSINLELSNGRNRVNIGSSEANQPAVLGDNFIMDWFLEFMRILITPTSMLGNMGAPVLKPELDAHIQQFLANPRKFISDYVFIADRIPTIQRDTITSEIEHDDVLMVNPYDNNPEGTDFEKTRVINKDTINTIKSDQQSIINEFKQLNLDLSEVTTEVTTIKRNKRTRRRKNSMLKQSRDSENRSKSINNNQNYGTYYKADGQGNNQLPETSETNTHTVDVDLTLQEKVDKIRDLIPSDVYNELPAVLTQYDLTSDLRFSHFISQLMHESGNFRAKVENLNYSENALLSVFGKYFNRDTARQYARNPEMIGSRVYGNRMGNNDEPSREGWIYRGRGYIQLTGKENYSRFSKSANVDFVQFPDMVSSSKYSLSSAAWFITSNRIHLICDRGNDLNTIKEVTRRINGGFNGLDDRINKFNLIYKRLKT